MQRRGGCAAHEVLAAVYGREGYITTYKRDMVNNIAFVIFDTSTEKSRTVGVSLHPARPLRFVSYVSLNGNLDGSRSGRRTRDSHSGSPMSSL